MIFVTAFDPFGAAGVNGSREAALLWQQRDQQLQVAILPVVRGLAWRVAQTALELLPEPPRLWIALGEAGRQPDTVRLEKVAVNWDDFRLPDNLGAQPRDQAIVTGGADAHFSTVPVGRIAQQLTGKAPFPVEVSLSAGAFLCNHLAYRALDANLPFPFVFVHVPAWRLVDGPERLENLVTTLQWVSNSLVTNQ